MRCNCCGYDNAPSIDECAECGKAPNGPLASFKPIAPLWLVEHPLAIGIWASLVIATASMLAVYAAAGQLLALAVVGISLAAGVLAALGRFGPYIIACALCIPAAALFAVISILLFTDFGKPIGMLLLLLASATIGTAWGGGLFWYARRRWRRRNA